MRILLLNPPHTAIGSRIPHEHLPPLGLLSVGGPLIDAGHTVELLDAEFGPLSVADIVRRAAAFGPGAVLLGHSGSTSAHPTVAIIARALKEVMPAVFIVYGGVYPTFAWERILREEPPIDIIVRGEGEVTAPRLMTALENGTPLKDVPGLAFRLRGRPFCTPPAPVPENLDDFRVGWELIDHRRYTYWGDKRAVVVQFSRGCPHQCTYCGQQVFWRKWRHRSPRAFAAEIASLHRRQGVEVFNLADENPTASREAWREFLEALVAENVTVILVGSTRADDIVRDADILSLYKRAGVARFLLGIEHFSEETLRRVRKDSSKAKDREAIRLLREHGILSMATYVIGFEEERDRDYAAALRHLLSYDPDQIQLLYAAPHHWTAFSEAEAHRRVIQTDLRKWDYKHQVLATRHTPPWRVLCWVKFIEAVMQARPRALARLYAHPDRALRAAMRWYYRIGRRVWPYEIWQFLFRDKRTANGPSLAAFQDPRRNESPEKATGGYGARGVVCGFPRTPVPVQSAIAGNLA
jgi:anaerobic magnesium-protoporphyrin IX monomethyl ester cyclase